MIIPGELEPVLLGGLLAGGFALLTLALSLFGAEVAATRQHARDARRFREERSWDARRDAYTEILKHCRSWEVRVREHRGVGSYGAWKCMFEALDTHRVVVSHTFSERLLRLADDVRPLGGPKGSGLKTAEAVTIATEAYESLLRLARAELAPHGAVVRPKIAWPTVE